MKRILIIDDDKLLLSNLSGAFKEDGFEVVSNIDKKGFDDFCQRVQKHDGKSLAIEHFSAFICNPINRQPKRERKGVCFMVSLES